MKTSAASLRRPFWYYLGPAFLVSVGYMDPGNWATSLEAGSRYGYALLWIVTLSSAIAVLMQVLAAKLGIATGMDLAQAMRARYSPPVARFLFVTAFLAMMATDLAEFMGVALALNLLFGIPLTWAVVLTVFDVLLILWLERFGFRWVEVVITAFVATIGLAYVIELFLAHPSLSEVAKNAFLPNPTPFQSTTALFLAMGILGATVMPHNLFLHSAQVKTRVLGNDERRRRIYFWSMLDTLGALFAAWQQQPPHVECANGHLRLASVEGSLTLTAEAECVRVVGVLPDQRRFETTLDDTESLELVRRLADTSPTLDLTDGIKLDGGDVWLSLRPSNTEPILRLMGEIREESSS